MKDNFDLFQEATRQLEDKYFQKKLEQVRTISNAEGRQWLTGLMMDLEKWAHLPVGRPEVLAPREWFPGQPPRRQPMWAYLWD